MKYIAWFSCGATSAVACKLALKTFGYDNVDIWYIDTGSHHPDNERFLKNCEQWYNKTINIAKSPMYESVIDCCSKRKIFNTPAGSPCTLFLKKEVRQNQIMPRYKEQEVIHILGFEYTKREANRALRWKQQQTPNCYFPLIVHRLNKQDCLKELQKNSIEIPTMYYLGYNNNNCVGCCKGGAGYWNKIRKDFPEVFEKFSKVEQEIQRSVLKRDGKPLFLNDLSEDSGRHTDIDIPSCGLFCDVVTEGLPIYELEDVRERIIGNG